MFCTHLVSFLALGASIAYEMPLSILVVGRKFLWRECLIESYVLLAIPGFDNFIKSSKYGRYDFGTMLTSRRCWAMHLTISDMWHSAMFLC